VTSTAINGCIHIHPDTEVNLHTPCADGTACDNKHNSDAEGLEGVKNTIEAIFSWDRRRGFEDPQNGGAANGIPVIDVSGICVDAIQGKGRRQRTELVFHP